MWINATFRRNEALHRGNQRAEMLTRRA